MRISMRYAAVLCFVILILAAFAGAALAAEMSGEVTAVDAAKGTLTLKTGTVEVGFDCETGSMIKDVKVGDRVTVQYNEEGGKKKATLVTPMKKRPAVGC